MLPELLADDETQIFTPRLDLVPLTAADADDLFPLLKDPALGRFTGESPPVDVEAVRARFKLWEGRRSPDGTELWLNWVVRLKDDNRAVGLVAATVGENDTAVAWIIGTAFQQRGFATEAGNALIEWLRDGLGVLEFVASIAPDHVASQTVAHRIGMHPTERSQDDEVLWEYVPPA